MSITEPKLRTHVERVVRLMKNLSEDLPRAASALSPAKGLNNSDSRPTSRRSIKPSMSKVRIGDLDLEASEAWGFRQMGPMVLARRDAGCGSLQISTAFRYKLQGAQTPEACLALAREFVSRTAISEPFDTRQVVDGGLLFGGFSYSAGEEFGRVWYSASRRQLVLGVYGCSREKQQPSEISECEFIMKSAHYV